MGLVKILCIGKIDSMLSDIMLILGLIPFQFHSQAVYTIIATIASITWSRRSLPTHIRAAGAGRRSALEDRATRTALTLHGGSSRQLAAFSALRANAASNRTRCGRRRSAERLTSPL
jgi:hypothetical protein